MQKVYIIWEMPAREEVVGIYKDKIKADKAADKLNSHSKKIGLSTYFIVEESTLKHGHPRI